MKPIKLFINGQFQSSSDNRDYITYDKANGEPLGRVELPSQSDINLAVESAKQAFYSEEWTMMDKNKRADLLLAISDKIKERKEQLIELEIKDSGSTLRKAKADVHNTASYFKVLSKQLRSFEFEIDDTAATVEGFSKNKRIYAPVGICAQIIPWNFPLVMAAWKIGPVIASGCTTVLKTASETPITASILAEIISEAGVPKGVVNIITGDAAEGKQLMNHPDVNKIAFTGSTTVGKQIYAAAAQDVKNITLELGGKSANIIMDDADLDIAVDGALYAFLYHSGQACDSGTRLLVQNGIYEEFMIKFKKRIAEIKVGVPSDPTTGMGPVINQKQFDSIINYIQISKKEDAKLIFGGKRVTGGAFDKGYYIEPTAFEINPDHTIWHEEIFGPVVGITKFYSVEEGITLANNSKYGLAAAVWSQDETKAVQIAKKIEAGTVWINEYHLLNPGMPFGGYKQSGIGREMGPEGFKAYLEVKHLWVSDCNERVKKPWFDAIF